MGTIIGFALGIAAILLGMKGFTREGLPLSKKKNLTGTTAQIIGVCCILLGAFFIVASALGVIIAVGRAAN